VRHIDRIDRRKCRDRFERRFTARRMATEYVDVYRELAATRSGLVA
jgi:glycosyltransferase involved in cell wall biosynthesis